MSREDIYVRGARVHNLKNIDVKNKIVNIVFSFYDGTEDCGNPHITIVYPLSYNVVAEDDEDLDAFLFSLGCYTGEPITVVSRRRGSCVVSIKDGRYTIDDQLAEAICI